MASLTLNTFKYLWVLTRKRKSDKNVAAIGVFQTRKEGRKLVQALKDDAWTAKNNRYTLKRKLFYAKYKLR